MPRSRAPRRRRIADWQVDLAICVLLFAFGVLVAIGDDPPPHGGWSVALSPFVLAPILLRRRDALLAAVAFLAGCAISALPTLEQFRIGLAVPAAMLIAYSLGAHEERRRALIGLGLVLAATLVVGATEAVLEEEGDWLGTIPFAFPLCGGVWFAGRLVRSRARLAGELAERSRLLERQREQTAQVAVEIERTRLAVDLDIAARARVREMVELAARGERELATDVERSREAFAWMERAGRESLNEMRGLLGVLRSDERGARFPRPTLAELDTLLAEARAGGRAVELDVEGERRPLPGGIELAAYRALQNALIAVRGDGHAAVVVKLRYLPDALELEVSGLAAEDRAAEAAVVAARERVAAYGGNLHSDAVAPGRRVVRARLPLVAAHV